MPQIHDTYAGPICGLYLPCRAWEALRQEGIKTIDQLSAIADRLEQFEGVEPRIAHVIRQALAYAALREDCTLFEGQPSPSCA
jgi:hypothetical protein